MLNITVLKNQLATIRTKIIPNSIKRPFTIKDQARRLRSVIPTTKCETQNLRLKSAVQLNLIFNSDSASDSWSASSPKLEAFDIPTTAGGVNVGDRRAIYYLIHHLKPSSVLEVGTHIGASTTHIAQAMFNENKEEKHLTSVDIVDVNSQADKPWLMYGSNKSPMEMVTELGFGDSVSFVADTSLNYFSSCDKKFDLIFLDGDHSASTVYQEIPVALRFLNEGGVILLHDYFPNLKPLWNNGAVIPGPYLATQRLIEEGAQLSVTPLGELPWHTKLQSKVTSLALLLKKGLN